MSNNQDVQLADDLNATYEKLKQEIGKVIYGQKEVIHLLITSMFCEAHSLLVGVPGLAKTLVIQTISQALGLKFNRIQFTPDLMPSDIIGSEMLDQERNFKFIHGPIFSNIVLADEINRTPPKTQSALLEAMQEYSVTVAGQKHELDRPFFVLATQNPIEQEGTYPLPEAQLDRFMFMIHLDYPNYDTELEIAKRTTSGSIPGVNQVLDQNKIIEFQKLIKRVPVADNVFEYVVKLVQSTRPNSELAPSIVTENLEWGAGPRATQNLIFASKCNALLEGKYSPDIEDVKAISKPILRHRIFRNYKAEANGITSDGIIESLL